MEAELEDNVPPSNIDEILPLRIECRSEELDRGWSWRQHVGEMHWTKTESKDSVSERGAGRRLILTVTCRREAMEEDWVEGLHLDEQHQQETVPEEHVSKKDTDRRLSKVVWPRLGERQTTRSWAKRCTEWNCVRTISDRLRWGFFFFRCESEDSRIHELTAATACWFSESHVSCPVIYRKPSHLAQTGQEQFNRFLLIGVTTSPCESVGQGFWLCWRPHSDESKSKVKDSWYVDGNRSLSDSWTCFTRFTLLDGTPRKGYMWSEEEADTNSNDITSRSHMAWRLEENWKSRSKKRGARKVYRRDNTRICQNFEGKFILLIQATKITKTSSSIQGESWRHQRLRQHRVKEEFSKASIRKFEESGARTEFKRQRVDFSTHRIQKGHIAGKEKNSVVYCNLVAKQVKPRKGPNATLKKRRVHKSSDTLRTSGISPKLRKRQSENPSNSERKSYQDFFFRLCCGREENLEGWHTDCWHWRIGKVGQLGKTENLCFLWQMDQQN